MGVMSSSVYSPRDHVEESLPLPRGSQLIGEKIISKESNVNVRCIYTLALIRYQNGGTKCFRSLTILNLII